MSDTLKRLASGTLGSADTNKYSVPANTNTILKEIILANTLSTDQTVTVKINDTLVDTVIISNKTIAANDTYVIELHTILPAGGILKGSCSTVNGVSFYASGIEVA